LLLLLLLVLLLVVVVGMNDVAIASLLLKLLLPLLVLLFVVAVCCCCCCCCCSCALDRNSGRQQGAQKLAMVRSFYRLNPRSLNLCHHGINIEELSTAEAACVPAFVLRISK